MEVILQCITGADLIGEKCNRQSRGVVTSPAGLCVLFDVSVLTAVFKRLSSLSLSQAPRGFSARLHGSRRLFLSLNRQA